MWVTKANLRSRLIRSVSVRFHQASKFHEMIMVVDPKLLRSWIHFVDWFVQVSDEIFLLLDIEGVFLPIRGVFPVGIFIS